MSLENIEIELKFPLHNKEELVAKLHNIIGEPKTKEQKDVYYVPTHDDYTNYEPINKRLRIRYQGEKVIVAFKDYYRDEKIKASICDENETEVADAEQMDFIFKKMGFVDKVTVDKVRQSRIYKNIEICVDEIKNLGSFIELEAHSGFTSAEEAEKALHDLLQELGAEVGEQDFRGYPYHFLGK